GRQDRRRLRDGGRRRLPALATTQDRRCQQRQHSEQRRNQSPLQSDARRALQESRQERRRLLDRGRGRLPALATTQERRCQQRQQSEQRRNQSPLQGRQARQAQGSAASVVALDKSNPATTKAIEASADFDGFSVSRYASFAYGDACGRFEALLVRCWPGSP